MSNVYNVAVVVGSLRKASINRKVALALAELAPANLKLNIVEIGDLPLYNEDIDVDRVLQRRRHRAVVFRGDKQQSVG